MKNNIFVFLVVGLGLCLINPGCDRNFSPVEVEKPKSLVRKQMVLFSSDRNGGNMNIWMMSPDGKELRQITHYLEGDFYPADISPDGKNLLFNRFDQGTLISGIYMIPLDDPEPSITEPLVYGLAQAGNFFPDGKKFVYFQHIWLGSESHDALFIFDLKDSSSVQISPSNIANWRPQVSPNGQQICFMGFFTDSIYNWPGTAMYMMNIDGTGKHALTPEDMGVCANNGRFSYDGTKIFLTMNLPIGSIYDLHFIDLNTGKINLITQNNKEDFNNPCPDTSGMKIYCRYGGGAYAENTSEIVVIDIDGSHLKKLTRNRFREDMPIVGVVEFYK